MAEDMVKGFQFFDDDPVYVSDAGRSTEEGGEVFNDYVNNQALAPYSTAAGINTYAGVYGYKLIGVSTPVYYENGRLKRIRIIVDDSKLADDMKVVNNPLYVKNAILCFDGASHFYNDLKISEIYAEGKEHPEILVSVSGYAKNPEAGIKPDYNSDGSLNTDPMENWVWIVGQDKGELMTRSQGASASGVKSIAIGYGAHAEGRDTKAVGDYSHAEGRKTIANYAAHAEGYNTQAVNQYAHAEGVSTKAVAQAAHAEGQSTIASGVAQHVQGRFNIEDTASDENGNVVGKYAHIVGNGREIRDENDKLISTERSNAHTLDWEGNAWFAGDVTVNVSNELDKEKISLPIGQAIIELAEIIDELNARFPDCIQAEEDDWNNATKSGYYYASENTPKTANKPNNGVYESYGTFFGEVITSPDVILQKVYSYQEIKYSDASAYTIISAQRYAMRNGDELSWENWEWITPPLISHRTYRTTEKYRGKPVYTSLVESNEFTITGNSTKPTTTVELALKGNITPSDIEDITGSTVSPVISALIRNEIRIKNINTNEEILWPYYKGDTSIGVSTTTTSKTITIQLDFNNWTTTAKYVVYGNIWYTVTNQAEVQQ